MALVIRRILPEPNGLPVFHFAPEASLADMLIEKYGEGYTPADFDPEAYAWSKTPVRKVDLKEPLQFLPTNGAQVLMHSHVLEHIPTSIDKIITELNASIAPGGYHVFQVPIHRGWYREDMDPLMSPEERTERFYQFDHLRVFGMNDFEDRCLSLFKGFTRLDLSSFISIDELVEAEVPPSSLTKLTGHTPFVFVKNG